jgi:hypothetical protein
MVGKKGTYKKFIGTNRECKKKIIGTNPECKRFITLDNLGFSPLLL